MPLYDNPPHRIDLATLSTSADSGGGVQNTYTTVQSAVPCLLQTASSNEVELFAQMGLTVSHVAALLSSVLTTTPVRGMRVTADDAANYHVEGIRKGRAVGNIPAFVYIGLTEQL